MSLFAGLESPPPLLRLGVRHPLFFCFAVAALVMLLLVAAGEPVSASSVSSQSRLGVGEDPRVANDLQAPSVNDAMQSFVVDVTGPESIVVENWSGIYASSDAGERWTRIFDADPVTLTHIVGIVSFGTRDIWLREIGDARYDFVPYSRDGGRTWAVSTLPGGANNPGSISFANSLDGTLIADEATVSGGVPARFSTTDGGRTWRRVASSATRAGASGPTRGSLVVGGEVPTGLRIQDTYYASSRTSWAQAASSSGATYLLRSTDSGRDWMFVPDTGVLAHVSKRSTN